MSVLFSEPVFLLVDGVVVNWLFIIIFHEEAPPVKMSLLACTLPAKLCTLPTAMFFAGKFMPPCTASIHIS
ncbi:hypothetical protein BaLi_c13280 [Bacillus paralicheniformis ATCC 9945a]|nr:hypothetical protein BaLi_c13280 [Bacillus paralicheniformis ATCC 9945a]